MLRSPLSWLGGKSRVRNQLYELFPKHVCFVEVFAGAASVILGKDPTTSRSEVLNDMDGELINFWRIIKHRPAEFVEAASWMIPSRVIFNELRSTEGVGGEVTRAVHFFTMMKLSFGARRMSPSFGFKRKGRPVLNWPVTKQEVKAVVDRLRIVWVERLPWDKLVDLYDSKDTFFYLDPPYRVESAKAYRHFFSDEDHARLADRLLASVKGKWLLSYNDDRYIRALYRGRGIKIGKLETTYTIQKGDNKRHATELLIRNF